MGGHHRTETPTSILKGGFHSDLDSELLVAFELHSVERIQSVLDAGLDLRHAIRGKPPATWLTEMYSRGDGFAKCLRLVKESFSHSRMPRRLINSSHNVAAREFFGFGIVVGSDSKIGMTVLPLSSACSSSGVLARRSATRASRELCGRSKGREVVLLWARAMSTGSLHPA